MHLFGVLTGIPFFEVCGFVCFFMHLFGMLTNIPFFGVLGVYCFVCLFVCLFVYGKLFHNDTLPSDQNPLASDMLMVARLECSEHPEHRSFVFVVVVFCLFVVCLWVCMH